jgi:homocysteine S-methyltransferase
LRDAVAIAALERDRFVHRHPGVRRPLIAASVGPFGASLQNGAEYTGDYDVTPKQLISHHVERLRVLSETDADFIACETIPSLPEARVLLDLLTALPHAPAWISFTCRDATHLADGNDLREVLIAAQDVPNLCAIGVNCIAPQLALPLMDTLLHYASAPIIVYPNASNAWDITTRETIDITLPQAFAEQARLWRKQGAQIFGGCCCTTPDHIRAMANYPTTAAIAAVQ